MDLLAETARKNRELRTGVRQALGAVDWDFPDSNNSESLHSIHPYPAKFIPEIPSSLIRTLGVPKGSGVFDPFCGCGTTLAEAQSAGVSSVGVDLNPIACLISRVKTNALPSDFYSTAERLAAVAAGQRSPRIPAIPNLGHWFTPGVQVPLAALASAIGAVEDPNLLDHLRLALSSIIVRVSNQDSDTRYAAVEKAIRPEQVCRHFLGACRRLVETKTQWPVPSAPSRVLQSDILCVSPEMVPFPIGLVITSPPYPNAYEYWLYHKYRMWWLGFDPLAVKEKEIGARAHYFKKNHPTAQDFERQMKTVLGLVARVLLPGGYVCIVVGRSRIHGQDVDNARLIAGAGLQQGLSRVTSIERRIAARRKSFNLSHARIRTEHLLVFRNAR